MIRGYKTISFDAAFVIADILPIDLRIQYLNHIYTLRTNGVFLGLRCQLKVPISSLHHPASIILRATCNDNHDFIIFTDGLANYCTVYQAEQFAIERAAFWIKDKQSTAIIYTDSLSTVNVINNRWNTDYLVHQIRTWIKDKHICIEWIRGHQLNIGNELADKLAKEATTMNNITFFFCPFNYLKKIIRLITTIKWNRLWLSSNNGRVTRLFFPTIFHRRNSNLSPDYVITQFISNHGDFRSYLYRINRANDPYCAPSDCLRSSTLRHHCVNIVSPLRHHCVTIASTLWHHCVTIASPLRHHCVNIASTLRQHCVTIASPLRYSSSTLRQHCVTARQHCQTPGSGHVGNILPQTHSNSLNRGAITAGLICYPLCLLRYDIS
ncbi:hypothetical protein DERP_015251 [Dermatophagoides pteronyssinus]|uniref:RNase H type-1 domain-containing protein n=1 Tax=Dermatophagoides pteronyssinus TaxID=6956 RepID=A0ABQ8IVU6_DERPT|nr:hypothetical protein DERP_015251 [Dermatophagoides pteronyssinus]